MQTERFSFLAKRRLLFVTIPQDKAHEETKYIANFPKIVGHLKIL